METERLDNQKRNIEFLIVFILIGSLVLFFISRIDNTAKRARETEAKIALSAIRLSQMRYYAEHDEYNFDNDLVDSVSGLDISISPSKYYEYKALGNTSVAEIGDNIIGAAIPKAGTGLERLFMDREGKIYYSQ